MRYLGIDFGLRRVGLATSEGELSSPFKTIEVTGLKNAVKQVVCLLQKDRFEKIIVGLPEGKMGKTVLGFVQSLKEKGFNIETADETLSSQKAISRMIELNISKNKRRISDAYSAAIILQDYLNEQT